MARRQYNKYVMFKRADLKLLSNVDKDDLKRILNNLAKARSKMGKKENKYIICNQDEPYAQMVWALIIQGETEKGN